MEVDLDFPALWSCPGASDDIPHPQATQGLTPLVNSLATGRRLLLEIEEISGDVSQELRMQTKYTFIIIQGIPFGFFLSHGLTLPQSFIFACLCFLFVCPGDDEISLQASA